MKSLGYNLIALAILAIAITPSLAFGQNNTGTGAVGVQDPYYNLGPAPPFVPLTVLPDAPFPGWVMPSPGSSWVNPWGNNVPWQRPPGNYTYTTSFTLPTPPPLNIEGEFAADNSVCITVNGTVTTICTTGGNHGFTHYTHFTIPSPPLTAGNNTLNFVVNNQDGPTGLEVEFYCPLAPGPVGTITGFYDDGPVNAGLDAWTINFGYVVSDSFYSAHIDLITGICFGAWSAPGVVPNTVDWSITYSENAPCPGEECLGNGTAPLTCDLYCSAGVVISPANGYTGPIRTCGMPPGYTGPAYDVYACTAAPINVQPPESELLWVNLMNATTNPSGQPVYWDQNNGVGCSGPQCPSLASENVVGTIPPESFVIYGIDY